MANWAPWVVASHVQRSISVVDLRRLRVASARAGTSSTTPDQVASSPVGRLCKLRLSARTRPPPATSTTTTSARWAPALKPSKIADVSSLSAPLLLHVFWPELRCSVVSAAAALAFPRTNQWHVRAPGDRVSQLRRLVRPVLHRGDRPVNVSGDGAPPSGVAPTGHHLRQTPRPLRGHLWMRCEPRANHRCPQLGSSRPVAFSRRILSPTPVNAGAHTRGLNLAGPLSVITSLTED